jgi:hypothetical protein
VKVPYVWASLFKLSYASTLSTCHIYLTSSYAYVAYLLLAYTLLVPIYIRGASHILYMLHCAFQRKFNHVQTLWGGGCSNMCSDLCYMLIIIFYEL